MVTILRLILFGISCVGSWELIRRKSSVHVYFLPSLTIAIQITFLFAAGLLNILPAAVIVLFAAGIAGVVYSIIKDRNLLFLKHYLKVGYLFLAVVSVIMLIFVYGKIFAHNDNFSHWALVVKNMFLTDRYPNFLDETILFRQYPLGSASFIYYFAKVVSGSESVQMFAQIYLMITCIMPLFIFCKKHQPAAFLTVLAATNFFFVYNVSLTNLLVDTMLPLFSMCSLLYAYLYGHTMQNRLPFYGIVFYLIALVQIKNSGLFFAGIIMLWMLIGMKRDKKVIPRLLTIAWPLFTVYLWQRHCRYVFSDAAVSKHAMSAEYYSSVIGNKTPEEIQSITGAWLRFSVSWKDIWLVFGLVVLIGIMIFLFARKDLLTYVKVALISVVMYILYQVGLLAMYLFSMPSIEAAYLAEIERYTRTILIAVVYLVMVMAVKMISDMQRKTVSAYGITAVLIAAFCGILLGAKGQIRLAVQYTDNPQERDWIEKCMEEYQIPYGASYLILPSYDDGAYSYFLGMYVFGSPRVNEMVVEKETDLDDMPYYEYIFIYDQDNRAIEDWVNKNYPEQAGNEVIIRHDLIGKIY